jgi:hypothetical protein
MANNSGSIEDIRKKFYEIHELASTSIHESGHVIYGLLHHVKIESVQVFENKKNKRVEGLTHYESRNLPEINDIDLFNERLHTEICLSYAGLIAEQLQFKIITGSDKFPMFLKEGSSDDITSAADLFQKYNLVEAGRKRLNYKRKLFKLIKEELQNNWDAVTLVAHNLFKKKKLNHLDLQKLLTRKTKDKQFWRNKFKEINSIYHANKALDEKDILCIVDI